MVKFRDIYKWVLTEICTAFNIVVTFPTIFFLFKETTQVSLEDVDLLFGERALGTLPEDLNKGVIKPGPVIAEAETKEEVEGIKAWSFGAV